MKKLENTKKKILKSVNYLEIAKEAINGLGKEVEEINQQARYVNLNHSEKVFQLRYRIDEYLHIDKLRPNLIDAIGGLKGIKGALQDHSERFWQLPGVKENKKEAVSTYVTLLKELEEYLTRLDTSFIQYRATGTGLGVMELNNIKRFLVDERPKDIVKKELIEYIEVSDFEHSPDLKYWKEIIEDIMNVYERLRTSFTRIV